MTRSMTAFSRQESQQSWGTLVWEIRSVNHRYLEPSLRIAESLREIEPKLRETLRKTLSRGKLDCSLRLELACQQQSISINQDKAKQLIDAAQQLSSLCTNAQPINTLEVLRWPGVMQEGELDINEVKQQALKLFNQALADLNSARDREGTELATLIHQRLDAINIVVADVRSKMPAILAQQKSLMLTRVNELQLELEPMRIEQEIALLAQKADVAEELDRLDTHVQEVRRLLNQQGVKGRRLDFLMQELNREANTLSSKAIVVDTTNSAVELKVLIEQMREQIQNIE